VAGRLKGLRGKQNRYHLFYKTAVYLEGGAPADRKKNRTRWRRGKVKPYRTERRQKKQKGTRHELAGRITRTDQVVGEKKLHQLKKVFTLGKKEDQIKKSRCLNGSRNPLLGYGGNEEQVGWGYRNSQCIKKDSKNHLKLSRRFPV